MPDIASGPAQQDRDSSATSQASASEHVSEAHELLKRLRQKVQHHPELDAAIERLELALADLNISTGGML